MGGASSSYCIRKKNCFRPSKTDEGSDDQSVRPSNQDLRRRLDIGKAVASSSNLSRRRVENLAFEIASTFEKAERLMRYLPEDNDPEFIRREMNNVSVRLLVHRPLDEVLQIIMEDKRQEYRVLFFEVETIALLMYDKKEWNLKEVIETMERGSGEDKLKQKALNEKNELKILVKGTAVLYDAYILYGQQEQREPDQEGLGLLWDVIPIQQGRVDKLKPASLWPKELEEIVGKLIDILAYIHLRLTKLFGNFDETKAREPSFGLFPTSLGATGLSLYYAELVLEIFEFAQQPSTLDAEKKDRLYEALPENIKLDLRTRRLISLDIMEELSVNRLDAKFAGIFNWLLALADNTKRIGDGRRYGRVEDWSRSRHDFRWYATYVAFHIPFLTLHHAEKERIDTYIAQLVILLTFLLNSVQREGHKYVPWMRLPISAEAERSLKITQSSMPHTTSEIWPLFGYDRPNQDLVLMGNLSEHTSKINNIDKRLKHHKGGEKQCSCLWGTK